MFFLSALQQDCNHRLLPLLQQSELEASWQMPQTVLYTACCILLHWGSTDSDGTWTTGNLGRLSFRARLLLHVKQSFDHGLAFCKLLELQRCRFFHALVSPVLHEIQPLWPRCPVRHPCPKKSRAKFRLGKDRLLVYYIYSTIPYHATII